VQIGQHDVGGVHRTRTWPGCTQRWAGGVARPLDDGVASLRVINSITVVSSGQAAAGRAPIHAYGAHDRDAHRSRRLSDSTSRCTPLASTAWSVESAVRLCAARGLPVRTM